MSIMLGNLTTAQIQERLGIALSESEIAEMENSRQNNAQNVARDKWHCFDMPFVILCGSREAAVNVHSVLSPYADKMACQIQICVGAETR